MEKIKISLEDLKYLLIQQKKITASRLLSQDYVFNCDSTEGDLKSMNIDKEKFNEIAINSPFPDDFIVLEKYLD